MAGCRRPPRRLKWIRLNESLGRGVRKRLQAAATLATVRDHRQRLAAGLNRGQLPERCVGLAASPLGLSGDVAVALVDQEALLELAVASNAFVHG